MLEHRTERQTEAELHLSHMLCGRFACSSSSSEATGAKCKTVSS